MSLRVPILIGLLGFHAALLVTFLWRVLSDEAYLTGWDVAASTVLAAPGWAAALFVAAAVRPHMEGRWPGQSRAAAAPEEEQAPALVGRMRPLASLDAESEREREQALALVGQMRPLAGLTELLALSAPAAALWVGLMWRTLGDDSGAALLWRLASPITAAVLYLLFAELILIVVFKVRSPGLVAKVAKGAGCAGLLVAFLALLALGAWLVAWVTQLLGLSPQIAFTLVLVVWAGLIASLAIYGPSIYRRLRGPRA